MIVQKIAELVGGKVKGNGGIEISDVRGIEDAGEGHITFLEKKKLLERVNSSAVSAVFVDTEMETVKTQVLVANPKLAFAKLVAHFHPEIHPKPGIDPRAAIGEGVSIGKDVVVSAFASIGDGSVIGDNSVLYPGVRIGERCQIGRGSVLYPNVVLYRNTVIGNHVILHAGVVVGADGFGYVPDEKGRHFKINQTGRVVIEDHVEIGANSCIDRAAMGATLVKEGVKIDNLVQIAHNCTIGEHSIIVAQAGVAGSSALGKRVILGGQVGVSDHVTLGDNVMLAAQAGTFRDIESNQIHGGSPSIPLTNWKKYAALLPDLPDFVRKLRDLEKRVGVIENQSLKD